MTPDVTGQLAALDLGSNSFHLVVAQHHNGHLQVIDTHKEMVRLAAGLDANNHLQRQVSERALQCLERFGQRLRTLPPDNVRVVGTYTLRRVRDGGAFLNDARARLGHEIDIISGYEEARLIYLGVSHDLEDPHDRRLVVDIGGGSTELILGQRFQPNRMHSLYMGCVSMSAACFADGRITSERLNTVELTALQELEPVQIHYRAPNWDTAIGASGTILTIDEVVRQQGWSSDGISAESLERLCDLLIEIGDIENLDLPGLDGERAPVFPGGVAILRAVFKALSIDHMQVSHGALREGLLHDLMGRFQQHDVRENSIRNLAERYHVDAPHARDVQATALHLYEHAASPWHFDVARHGNLLRWAAAVHEIGMDVAHAGYHKHGEYLLGNMNLAGFSLLEQRHLAFLVRAHRRKYPHEELENIADDDRLTLVRLSVLLRLAVTLHRSRTDDPTPQLNVRVTPKRITLGLSATWLKAHPLTALDLSQEVDYLKTLPVELRIKRHKGA
jgi:exopolyphosphatase/guanosine-5'-triphosphate,3'-diphosphate pyrophosphatase